MSVEASIASSIGGTPLGVRNAFQALNTYTLEEASKDVTYAMPATSVGPKAQTLALRTRCTDGMAWTSCHRQCETLVSPLTLSLPVVGLP